MLLAYLGVFYLLYAYLRHTSVDDPRLGIPAMGFVAIGPGILLLWIAAIWRKYLNIYERYTFVIIALLGLALLPGVFASALIFDW